MWDLLILFWELALPVLNVYDKQIFASILCEENTTELTDLMSQRHYNIFQNAQSVLKLQLLRSNYEKYRLQHNIYILFITSCFVDNRIDSCSF